MAIISSSTLPILISFSLLIFIAGATEERKVSKYSRYFNSYNDTTNEASPRDYDGHGTHTASTVAGRSVRNVSLYGLAGGMARGAVPSARLAVYKVCWPAGCASEDLLAAFDHAIADGVDIISISIGSKRASDYFEDPIAIGAFHAMKKGILTSASGGNEGRNGRGTVGNVAPWMLVSAASSIDRRIIDTLVIEDRRTIGASINTFPTQKKFYPFIYLGNGTFPPRYHVEIIIRSLVCCNQFGDLLSISSHLQGLHSTGQEFGERQDSFVWISF
ncbi:hypothetical protein BHE74_00005883 [Ensete ventricosum]|nr:hypothetical protein BHE74_00005883 [Ensete ventricosum]RZS07337.1 hypothetical protein BHM03_00038161 [Ensete ventricosum]